MKKSIKKVSTLMLSFMIMISMSSISFANSYDNGNNADTTSETSNDNAPRFEKYLNFVDGFEGVETKESKEKIISEEDAADTCEKLLEDSDTVEEIDDAVLNETSEQENNSDNYSLLTDDTGVTIINNDTKEYTSVSINDDGNVDVEMVEMNQNNEMVNNSVKVKIPEEDVIEGQGWESVVKETYKNKYWYQNSSTGAYVRIGCDAQYKINYNKLSNSKADNVRTYRSKVGTTKSKWAAFNGACTKAGISGIVVAIALAAAFGAAPETFGASLLIGVVVGLATGVTWNEANNIVTNYIATKKAYKKVKSTYSIIKGYGTRD